MRSRLAFLLPVVLVGALAVAVPPASAAPSKVTGSGLEVYTGKISPAQFPTFTAMGLDAEDVATSAAAGGKLAVEAVISDAQARKLAVNGIHLAVKEVDGLKASAFLARQARVGYDVYRSYSEHGGLRDELIATAAAYPGLTKLVNIGSSVDGQPILALKVTKDARRRADGSRPAVLYNGAQHAREWITPEMVRRLMHWYIDGYGTDPRITSILDRNELWFMPVSNPDGYDYTFTEGNRLWRKNLRDNDGDGQITIGDGVDPNRNFPNRWGYDNEGSSDVPSSETYRGTGPASEPETRALDALAKRIGFAYEVNYHSAAELLLYGVGWQVSTESPDDLVYQALAGTDDNSAIPGYDPDLSAELYTTNGETTEHMHETYGTLGYTPEMATCETAANSDPDDAWVAGDCASVFNFPDDEHLIQAEFEKNIPFALSVAQSARTPDSPVSSVGLTVPDFKIDPFATSYGTTQPVAVIARRSMKNLRMEYRINGGRVLPARARPWQGGERYGRDGDHYFGEYRGTVRGTKPGDSVEVWFHAVKPTGPVTSQHFTYKVASDIGGDVLILAAEDVTGASPVQDATNAKYADDYAAALTAAGYTSDVYDVDANDRVEPHHLGVLSHYKAVVWEHGDDIITRNAGGIGGTADKLALDLEVSVRDYLNEGGKLLYTGKYAGYAASANGSYFYNPFQDDPGQQPCNADNSAACLPLLNDFEQYWLGAYTYVDDSGTDADGQPFDVAGKPDGPFAGFSGTFNGPTSADNQDHTAAFLTTSSFLPPAQFPQFASSAPLAWERPGGAPFEPFTGDWYLASQQADVSYKRLTRTVDLTGASSGQVAFRTSYDTEPDWDFMFVEAHTVGQDDWTTLPDLNGHTTQDTGESCLGDWAGRLHPQLLHYQTLGGGDTPSCTPTGTTGEWNASTGSSAGWQDWKVDLSAFAGKQVELSISYASDDAVQGLGVFLDDASVAVDGATVASTSFEDGLGGWAVAPAPAGSGPNVNSYVRSQKLYDEGAAVVTDDTVYVGFGAEGLTTPAMRSEFVSRSLAHLLG